MKFGAVLYISGLRCLISGDTHVGKKLNPQKDALKDKAAIKAS
jgi:hypothetical protein